MSSNQRQRRRITLQPAQSHREQDVVGRMGEVNPFIHGCARDKKVEETLSRRALPKMFSLR
jgi:hypothetical protein